LTDIILLKTVVSFVDLKQHFSLTFLKYTKKK